MMTAQRIVVVGAVCFLIAQTSPSDVRVDTFDKRGNRTGYLIVDPRTGRVDQFDRHSNRTGFGYISTPAPGYGRGYELDQRRSIDTDGKLRP